LTLVEMGSLAWGAVLAITTSSLFILALFLGFCIILGFPKLVPTAGRKSKTVKSLEELVGQASYSEYMPPDRPRGPIDVLKTPELLERAAKAGTP
jgi:hypothetical protein